MNIEVVHGRSIRTNTGYTYTYTVNEESADIDISMKIFDEYNSVLFYSSACAASAVALYAKKHNLPVAKLVCRVIKKKLAPARGPNYSFHKYMAFLHELGLEYKYIDCILRMQASCQ